MKKQYVIPSLQIIHFDCEDIIITSGAHSGGGDYELPFVPAD